MSLRTFEGFCGISLIHCNYQKDITPSLRLPSLHQSFTLMHRAITPPLHHSPTPPLLYSTAATSQVRDFTKLRSPATPPLYRYFGTFTPLHYSDILVIRFWDSFTHMFTKCHELNTSVRWRFTLISFYHVYSAVSLATPSWSLLHNKRP